MILHLVNIEDAKSLACHPGTATDRQLKVQELATARLSEDLIRISVGIKHVRHMIANIEKDTCKGITKTMKVALKLLVTVDNEW